MYGRRSTANTGNTWFEGVSRFSLIKLQVVICDHNKILKYLILITKTKRYIIPPFILKALIVCWKRSPDRYNDVRGGDGYHYLARCCSLCQQLCDTGAGMSFSPQKQTLARKLQR